MSEEQKPYIHEYVKEFESLAIRRLPRTAAGLFADVLELVGGSLGLVQDITSLELGVASRAMKHFDLTEATLTRIWQKAEELQVRACRGEFSDPVLGDNNQITAAVAMMRSVVRGTLQTGNIPELASEHDLSCDFECRDGEDREVADEAVTASWRSVFVTMLGGGAVGEKKLQEISLEW